MGARIGRYLELMILTIGSLCIPVVATAVLRANDSYFRLLREWVHPGREAIALALFLIAAFAAPRVRGGVDRAFLIVLAIVTVACTVQPIHAMISPSVSAFVGWAGPALFLAVYATLLAIDTFVRIGRISSGTHGG